MTLIPTPTPQNFCTRCGCTFVVPGTCNCFAMQTPREQTHYDRCACNPKNGGSGVCGCVIGGTTYGGGARQ